MATRVTIRGHEALAASLKRIEAESRKALDGAIRKEAESIHGRMRRDYFRKLLEIAYGCRGR